MSLERQLGDARSNGSWMITILHEVLKMIERDFNGHHRCFSIIYGENWRPFLCLICIYIYIYIHIHTWYVSYTFVCCRFFSTTSPSRVGFLREPGPRLEALKARTKVMQEAEARIYTNIIYCRYTNTYYLYIYINIFVIFSTLHDTTIFLVS